MFSHYFTSVPQLAVIHIFSALYWSELETHWLTPSLTSHLSAVLCIELGICPIGRFQTFMGNFGLHHQPDGFLNVPEREVWYFNWTIRGHTFQASWFHSTPSLQWHRAVTPLTTVKPESFVSRICSLLSIVCAMNCSHWILWSAIVYIKILRKGERHIH